jgi:hypothetical protein
MDLQEQLEVGRQAEEFLKYAAEHPYFQGLLDRMKIGLIYEIGMLAPSQTDEFRTLKTRYDFTDVIIETVKSDIFLGAEALKKLKGEKDTTGGIL